MKLIVLIMLIVASLCITLSSAGGQTNIIHVQSSQSWSKSGYWRKRFEWKSRWVKTWKPKQIYVPLWKRVWGPVEIKEWIASPAILH